MNAIEEKKKMAVGFFKKEGKKKKRALGYQFNRMPRYKRGQRAKREIKMGYRTFIINAFNGIMRCS